jgi:hypothetical protein
LYRQHFGRRQFRIVCITTSGWGRDTDDTNATSAIPIGRRGDIAAIPGAGSMPLHQPAAGRPISECTAMLPRILTIAAIALAAALASTAAIAVAPDRNAPVQKTSFIAQPAAPAGLR